MLSLLGLFPQSVAGRSGIIMSKQPARSESLQRLLPSSPKKDKSLSERDISKHSEKPRTFSVWSSAVPWLVGVIIDQRFILYGVLVPVLLGSQLTAVKEIKSITPFQVLLYRSIVYLPSFVFISFTDVPTYNVSDWMTFFLCGACSVFALVLAYQAVAFAHVGNVSCIITNQPIPAAILNRIFFGEPMRLIDLSLVLCNFIGVFLVSRPPIIFGTSEVVMDYQREFIGALLAIASVTCNVVAAMVTKILVNKGKADTGLLIQISGVTGIIVALLQMALTNNFQLLPPFNECILVAFVAICSLLGSVLVVWALHKISFLVMSILFPLCIPVAFALGCIFLHEVPDLLSILGTSLIISSTIGYLVSSAMQVEQQGD